jgi:hypothetical protein
VSKLVFEWTNKPIKDIFEDQIDYLQTKLATKMINKCDNNELHFQGPK